MTKSTITLFNSDGSIDKVIEKEEPCEHWIISKSPNPENITEWIYNCEDCGQRMECRVFVCVED